MSGEILTVLARRGRGKPALPRGMKYADVIERYREMCRVRRLEEEGARRLRSGEVSFLVTGLGREAVLVGVLSVTERDDVIRASHRDHGAAILRGVPMARVFGRWLGRDLDPAAGAAPPLPLTSVDAALYGPSGSATAHVAQAAGHAHGLRLLGRDAVVVTFLGGGALDTSDVHAGFIAAARLAAPVVFVLTVPNGGSEAAAHRVRGYGLPIARVDGDDVVAVSEAARAALERARGGDGPVVVIAETASSSAEPHGADADPIVRVREFLRQRRALDEAADHELHAAIEAEACHDWDVAAAASPAPADRAPVHAASAPRQTRLTAELAARAAAQDEGGAIR